MYLLSSKNVLYLLSLQNALYSIYYHEQMRCKLCPVKLFIFYCPVKNVLVLSCTLHTLLQCTVLQVLPCIQMHSSILYSVQYTVVFFYLPSKGHLLSLRGKTGGRDKRKKEREIEEGGWGGISSQYSLCQLVPGGGGVFFLKHVVCGSLWGVRGWGVVVRRYSLRQLLGGEGGRWNS